MNRFPGYCSHCSIKVPVGKGKLKKFYGGTKSHLYCPRCHDNVEQIGFIGSNQSRASRQYNDKENQFLNRLRASHDERKGANRGKTLGQDEETMDASLLVEGGAAKEMNQLIKRAGKEGWSAEKTKKGHWRLTHPKAAYHVIAPGTPSDYRSVKNTESELRRALRAAEAGANVPVREIADSLIEGFIELA